MLQEERIARSFDASPCRDSELADLGAISLITLF
jgi:hypothetical protein